MIVFAGGNGDDATQTADADAGTDDPAVPTDVRVDDDADTPTTANDNHAGAELLAQVATFRDATRSRIKLKDAKGENIR